MSTHFLARPVGQINFIKMPDIQSVLNVTFQELSTDQQLVLKEAMDQF
jgi:hypothetical protein